jgi:hypothetical protein
LTLDWLAEHGTVLVVALIGTEPPETFARYGRLSIGMLDDVYWRALDLTVGGVRCLRQRSSSPSSSGLHQGTSALGYPAIDEADQQLEGRRRRSDVDEPIALKAAWISKHKTP